MRTDHLLLPGARWLQPIALARDSGTHRAARARGGYRARAAAAAAAPARAFQLHVGGRGLARLPSRGAYLPRDRANPSPHPNPNPKPHPNADQVRISREIVHQPAFDGLRGAEIQPGESVASDAQLDAYLAEHLESAYHPCGTCRRVVGSK